ncbi:MAG: hypothetical protein QOI95_3167 [Acidimicrobiaceae bacterium]|jgi:hypothetical protein
MKHTDFAAHLREIEELEDTERTSDAPSGQRVLDVQRTAGNQAVNALVVQAKLMVGKAADPAEHEADLRADHVLAALTHGQGTSARRSSDEDHGPDPLGGLDVSTETESEIDKQRGGGQKVPTEVRSAFGADSAALDSVRVHTDVHADRLSQSLQAKAFTTGKDIFFRQGTYNPASSDGKELLAHELSHVVQQGGDVQRRTVRRRIEPSTQYIFDEMSKKTTGKEDKKTFFKTPAYLRVKTDLDEYVQKQDTKDRKWKEAKLKSIDDNIAKWMADKKIQADASEDHKNRKEAMLWLVPRIQAEYTMMAKVTPGQQRGSGKSDSGGMNSVEVGVKTTKSIGTSKSKTGVFKAPPKGYKAWDAPAANASGIDMDDAQFTERAVASSAVAKLMGSDVIADTVKATRGGQKGYMMEQAKGVQPKGEKKIRPQNKMEANSWSDCVQTQSPGYGIDEKGPFKTEMVVNKIDWKDSRLQEQLVELQLLDAITGQVDRHASNYFVDQGPGKETKVKGIDPDLSFGKDKDVDQIKAATTVGVAPDKSMEELPPICTTSTAKRILAMTETDLRALLGSTLSRDELLAAIKRLQKVQAHLKQLMSDMCVFDSFEEEDENFRLNRFTEKNSYIGRDRYFQYRNANG